MGPLSVTSLVAAALLALHPASPFVSLRLLSNPTAGKPIDLGIGVVLSEDPLSARTEVQRRLNNLELRLVCRELGIDDPLAPAEAILQGTGSAFHLETQTVEPLSLQRSLLRSVTSHPRVVVTHEQVVNGTSYSALTQSGPLRVGTRPVVYIPSSGLPAWPTTVELEPEPCLVLHIPPDTPTGAALAATPPLVVLDGNGDFWSRPVPGPCDCGGLTAIAEVGAPSHLCDLPVHGDVPERMAVSTIGRWVGALVRSVGGDHEDLSWVQRSHRAPDLLWDYRIGPPRVEASVNSGSGLHVGLLRSGHHESAVGAALARDAVSLIEIHHGWDPVLA
jgi:hypothetical protein